MGSRLWILIIFHQCLASYFFSNADNYDFYDARTTYNFIENTLKETSLMGIIKIIIISVKENIFVTWLYND